MDAKGCGRVLAAFALLWMVPVAAQTGCGDQVYALDESKLTLGPAHHPMGRPLPPHNGFNQPAQCVDNLWFFDDNGNGQPDPAEIRVFGINRQVDCASCHGESVSAKSATSQSVFLRQDAATLCLVCHNL